MKNLTVNKIALGLFLAGFAASSAYALHSETSSPIQGNLPAFRARKANAVDHTMTVKILKGEKPSEQIGSRPAKVGDIIRIEYNLQDADGDLLKNQDNLKSTFSVFIKKTRVASEAWTKMAPAALKDLKFEPSTDGKTGVISFEISDSFSGAEKIGYQILERTDFGAPFSHKWLLVTDIWSNTNPATADPTDKNKPITTGPADPKDGTHGPGDSTNNGSGPIESPKTKIGIFKFDGAAINTTLDYSRNGALIPKYGDKFAAVVWQDEDNDNKLTTGDIAKSESYTFTWRLMGDYNYADQAAGTTTGKAKPDKITAGVSNGAGPWDKGVGNVIYLGAESGPHNAKYDATYPAGAQGFKLQVITN